MSRDAIDLILREIRSTCEATDPAAIASATEALETVQGRIFVTGQGRSGLVARMFAMRLMHLGRSSHVVGDTVTPAFGAGDLLMAISGSGETETTLLQARKVREHDGTLIAITRAPFSRLGQIATHLVILPVPATGQFGGSLFEQASLIVLDGMAHGLATGQGSKFDAMARRHANLE